MKTSSRLAILCLTLATNAFASGGAGCDSDGDGDGDTDAGTDADSDADGDADGDADTDADTDADGDGDADADLDGEEEADVERDLSRCGTGEEVCGDCHGGPDVGGPPPDTFGLTDPALITVGAHAQHFSGGGFTRSIPCTECHRMPVEVLDRGHCDSEMPAEVRFGELAASDGMYPYWDRVEGSCATVYCHGATLEGGRSRSPQWTTGGPMTCGGCHDVDTYHGQPYCSDCHESVTADKEIIAPELHINGRCDLVAGAR
jgi:predicted CxxxxCH...CXXCH cytochrome family protein